MKVPTWWQCVAVDKARAGAASPWLLVQSCKDHPCTPLSRRCPAQCDERTPRHGRQSVPAFRSDEREIGPDPQMKIPWWDQTWFDKWGEILTRCITLGTGHARPDLTGVSATFEQWFRPPAGAKQPWWGSSWPTLWCRSRSGRLRLCSCLGSAICCAAAPRTHRRSWCGCVCCCSSWPSWWSCWPSGPCTAD